MYDLSSKFNTFYNSHVVLSQAEQTNLHSKKDLNIQRLKDGLKEYNEENKTSYSIVDVRVGRKSPICAGRKSPIAAELKSPI